MSKGVLYIAVGESYTEMAIASAKSIKHHNQNLKIHLFTDQQNIQSAYVDSFGIIDDPHRRSKVDYISESPFNETLYLDADTFILENIEGLFEILMRYDLAIAHAHKRNIEATLQNWRKDIPSAFPQMNSGVILYKKNDRTEKLFKDWKTAFHESDFKKDQVTLRELIWLSDLQVHILPPEYNIRFKKFLDVWTDQEVKPMILHFEEFTVFFKDYLKKKNI